MINGQKYNAKKYELLRSCLSIKQKLIELGTLERNYRNCSQCNKVEYMPLRLQKNEAWLETEIIGRFCEKPCFDEWWKSEYKKPKKEKIRCLV
jgi:hypothetical protein